HYTDSVMDAVDGFEKIIEKDWNSAVDKFDRLDGTRWAEMGFIKTARLNALRQSGRSAKESGS
ncbi:MAG: hypothetical protein J7M12_02670, partial [Candidatus Hydrogenedentes bacterium]|nr:hypothetical protein [Candidatus Hydrogenedentota bacterium]